MSSAAAVTTPSPRRDWEAWLAAAAAPASTTEEEERDRTVARIRDAIRRAPDIPPSVRIYVKGSYANNTNVRRDADVDVAVEWTKTIKVKRFGDAVGLTAEQLGFVPVAPAITPTEFRRRVECALTSAFHSSLVDTTPDKHIGVAAGSNTLDADVVPCFALHRYDAPRVYHRGHRIFPRSGGTPVDNYPQQNYDNSVTKNGQTRRRYKEIVRCTKRVIDELYEEGLIARDYPGYLTESLVYNAPNFCFGHSRRYDDMQAVFRYLWSGLAETAIYKEWTEPSELKMLFSGRPDRSPGNARTVIGKAWLWIGGPDS